LCAGFASGVKIAVDAHHDEVRARNIAHGFEADGHRGDGSLNPIGAQVVPEPPHEPGIVDFADYVVIGLFGLLLFFFGHRLGKMRLTLLLYEAGIVRGVDGNETKRRAGKGPLSTPKTRTARTESTVSAAEAGKIARLQNCGREQAEADRDRANGKDRNRTDRVH